MRNIAREGDRRSSTDTNLEAANLAGETTTITFAGTCPGITGVEDQTAQVADLVAGSTYTIDVTWGTCGGSFTNSGSVWIDFDGSNSFDESEVIGDISYGGGSMLETYTFTVPVAALNGTHRMRINQQEGFGVTLPLDPCADWTWGTSVDFTIEISGGVDCAPPEGIELTDLTTTTANFEWDAAGTGEWQWDIVADGDLPVIADLTLVSPFPTTGIVTGLTENTNYDFYVRQICGPGDTSSFAGPFSFKTPCETVSGDDFCETFETDSETESCWQVLNLNGDADAFNLDYAFNPHTGAQSATITTDFNGGDNDDWLISPRLNLDGFKYLSFWYRVQSAGEPNDFEVLLSTTGSEPADFTETLMALSSYSNTTYADTLIDLADYADMDVYIAMRVPPAGLDGWRLYFDDICITNCPPLSDLTLDGVTATTADVSWTIGLDETAWVADIGAPGHEAGTGDIFSADMLSYEFTSLTPNTDYDVYVRTVCSGGDSTLWVGLLSFQTNCLPIDPAVFCETFEDDSETESCWTVLNLNDDFDAFNLDYAFNPHTGSQSATLTTDFNGGNNDDWLISPNVTLTGNEVISFWQRVQSAGEPNDFEVLLSTTGNSPEDFTTELLPLAVYSNTTYELISIDLSDYTGNVFIAFHVPSDGLDGWRLYFDDICFNICDPADGEDGELDVCIADGTTDLSEIITGEETFGNWEFPTNPALIDGNTFSFDGLAAGTYDVTYVVVGACSNDTTTATLNLFDAPAAGEGSTITTCANQPINLLSGLSGTVELGGEWTNEAGESIGTGSIVTNSEPGTYVYTYAASNGVCPDVESEVTIIVDNCDYLSIEGNELQTLNVYPNPTNDVVFVSANGATETFSFEVLDVTGRVVVASANAINGTNNVEIDLSNEENGIYMIRIFNENVEKTVRIAKN